MAWCSAIICLFLKDIIKVVIYAITSSILRQNSLNMNSSCFEAFMIFILTHILIKSFKSHFCIPSRFLNNSYSKQSKHKNNEDTCPCLNWIKDVFALKKCIIWIFYYRGQITKYRELVILIE